MTYTVLTTDGRVEPFTPAKRRPSLEELQGIVGGYIERVSVPGGELWVNEEGLLLNLPLNPRATLLAGGMIVGNALFAERAKRGAK